ncbi:MAG: MFS transporter, partial [Conexivisphaera sp.]
LAGILGPLMKEELHEMLSINVLSSAIWPLMTIYAEVFAIKVIGLSAPLAIVGVLLAAVTSMLSRVLLSFIGLERRPTLYFSIAAVSLGVITLSISSGVAQYYVATALIGLGHGLQMPLIYAATFESSQGREVESYAMLNATMGAGEFLASSVGTVLIALIGFRLGFDVFLALVVGISVLMTVVIRRGSPRWSRVIDSWASPAA